MNTDSAGRILATRKGKSVKTHETKPGRIFTRSNHTRSSVKLKMNLPITILGCLLLCCGCGRNSPESPTPAPPQTLEQSSQEKTNLEAVVEGNTAFAVDLYHQLRTAPGNLFFSPYSISSALAMTYAGARGETERQMARALHFSLPQERLHPLFAELQAGLNAAQTSNTIQLLVANSLWPAKGLSLQQDFLDRMQKNYQTRLTPLDYGQTEAARQTINRWVEDQTKQKIKELFQRGVLGPDTVLVLASKGRAKPPKAQSGRLGLAVRT